MPAPVHHLTGEAARRRDRRAGAGAFLGAVALVSVLALSACGSDSDGASTSTTKPDKADTTTTAAGDSLALDGKTFTSTGVTGHDLVEGSKIILTFQDGTLSVNAGCNSQNAAYEVVDGQLSWTAQPMATMMGCEDALQAQDQWLAELFTDGAEVALDGRNLTVTAGDVTIELEAPKPTPLEGTVWELESTLLGSSAASVPEGVTKPTLLFKADGTAEIFGGCNRGSTTVQISKDTISFGPIAMTKMFCEGAAGDVEQEVLQVLDGDVTYVIEANSLALANGDDGLVYKAKA